MYGIKICPGCGVNITNRSDHECHPDQYAAHQAQKLRVNVQGPVDALQGLDENHRKFQEWCIENGRL